MPTIYIGSCRDMMALVKPPRAVFVDFPLGRQCGKENDAELQIRILKDALQTLEQVRVPGEIVDLPYRWDESFNWESYERDLMEMLKQEGQSPQDWAPQKR